MDSIYRSRSGAEIRAIPASCDARASFAFASLLGKTSLQLSRGPKEDETNGGSLLKRYLLGGGFEGNQKDNSHVGGPKSKPQFCHIPFFIIHIYIFILYAYSDIQTLCPVYGEVMEPEKA